MRFVSAVPHYIFLVNTVLKTPGDSNRDGLVHLVADHFAGQNFSMSADIEKF